MPGELRWTEAELADHMRRIQQPTSSEPCFPLGRDKVPAQRSAVPKARAMNKTEAAYDALLCAQQAQGAILRHRFEAVTLTLAPGCRYTPDFMVQRYREDKDMIVFEFHEVKLRRRVQRNKNGPHMESDARVKLLTAAKLYPEFVFKLAWLDQGKWTIETVAG